MTTTIAIAGKGGVGKTTIAGLCVARLSAAGRGPVLAVDADPNSCLDQVLGVHVVKSVGAVREEARALAGKGLAAGVSKQQLLEMKIAESLVEADDFDLIAMGRPEGAGCYCYANNVLKQVLHAIADNYPAMVIDNEAGLENLSRRIVTAVDLLVIVADPSQRGLETVRRIHGLAGEMGVAYAQLGLVVNRLRRGALPRAAETVGAAVGADVLLGIGDDAELAAADEAGRPLLGLPGSNPVVAQVDRLLGAAGLGGDLDMARGA